MHRCFIEPENWHDELIVPSREESHHLLHVLRAGDGDLVAVFNGLGQEAAATVRRVGDKQLELIVHRVRQADVRRVDITLIVAIPKGSRSDLVVEKATELGIARIIPVISERVISRPQGNQACKKVARWQRVALAAAKQCGTKWLPQIEPIVPYASMLQQLSDFDVVLLGSLVDGVRPLRQTLQRLQAKKLASIAVIIGPEGDLTPNEIEQALAAGALPVSFGELTLRVETAAIYAASVLAYEFLWQ